MKRDLGIVEFHDTGQDDRGFNCMQLIAYLTDDKITDWDQWHGAHLQAASGHCPYATVCPIYARTIRYKTIQLALNFNNVES